MRRITTATALTIVLLATTWWQIAAQATPVMEEGPAMRVMTYNIKHGAGNRDCENPPATPGVPPAQAECAVDLEAVAEVVRGADPDIVAFQEVDRFWARSGNVDQADALASMLGMAACYAANLDHPADEHSTQSHQYGVLILSKYAITSCQNTLFPAVEEWEQRGLLDARVSVDGIGEVAILNSHFQAGREGETVEAQRQRTESAQIAADYAATLSVPWMLMGDLNAEAGDPDLQPLLTLEGATDAWAVAGEGNGYTIPSSPDEEAMARIDFVIVSSSFATVAASTIVNDASRIASDHFPVIADLRFAGAATMQATPIG